MIIICITFRAVKRKVIRMLNEASHLEVILGSGGIHTRLLSFAVAECNWLASRLGRLIPGGIAPDTH